MFDPLGLAKDKKLALKLKLNFKEHTFIYNNLQTYPGDCSKVARYTLKDTKHNKLIDIEISKDKKNSFHIYAYNLIETKPFNHKLSSILGVDSIQYQSFDDLNTLTKYHRINYKSEKLEFFKYICDPLTLPIHPASIGYEKDGNGQWYMLIYRSKGRVKKFAPDNYRRSWEYETQNKKRLLVELEESKYIDKNRFHIYNGQQLSRKELKLIRTK